MTSFKASTFKFIDLFSGIGGFRLALDEMGGQCVNFSEIHGDAIDTYCANFGEDASLNLGDITAVKSLPMHDLLTAGVPCQSWSIAGKNRGFDDDRGQLWNDTLFLLNQSRPKAFIFENVKGLVDPRNQDALSYILARIRQAGYHAKHYVLNASDYGVPQDRVRVYIVGFLDSLHFQKFRLPEPQRSTLRLMDVLQGDVVKSPMPDKNGTADLFGAALPNKRRYRKPDGMNDFFLFNDIRNGPTTIHSWDLLPTNDRQKQICLLLLRNRRKQTYGKLDGNPLSLAHLKALDASITQAELESLVDLGIFKKVNYSYALKPHAVSALDQAELLVLRHAEKGEITLDSLRACGDLKRAHISVDKTISSLSAKGVITCSEIRYEFRYTKISTGIEGINRVFLPQSEAFPTLVASDTNDFVALKNIESDTEHGYKQRFLQEIFDKKLFRKISKEEACLIQGFPGNFQLPESRNRWMKLVGNSVSVPVIRLLAKAISDTGCFAVGVREKEIDSSAQPFLTLNPDVSLASAEATFA
jgi:DNA (cytosine-5)-methyltransferase 1